MPQLKKLWTISNILLLAGCASIERPDTDLCIINSPFQKVSCYNLKRDYDEEGGIKPEAKPKVFSITGLQDINKFICTDSDGFANLKSYIKELKQQKGE